MASKTHTNKLNDKQWKAIVNENKRLLVLAGAGSGKTKTLIQKIIHLVESGVSPSDILAITFTKNATNEMIDRLIVSADISGSYDSLLAGGKTDKLERERKIIQQQKKFKWIDSLTVKTFHSFCYSILRNYGVNEFDNQFRIISDNKGNDDEELSKNTAPETVSEVVHRILIAKCEDPDFLMLLKRYILDYVVDHIHLTKADLPKEGKFFTSLDGTKVRSKSEQFIADWFYRHNIKYVYEPSLNVTDFTFHPDFFIPDANLYIEHVTEKSSPMANKEKQFNKGNLRFIKTDEGMTKDSTLFNHTLEKALKNRLPFDHKKAAKLNYNEEFNGYHDHVKSFVKQIIRVINMVKVENIDFEKVSKDAEKDQHERVRFFYQIAGPVAREYSQYCVNKSYLDFNDLISRSISLFKHHIDITNKYRNKYQYILVDEFQDVNNLQVELIKLLLTNHTQLFCVGDDWQSIYGFRGSNVDYIVDFEKHFQGAEVMKLNLNYRSTPYIVQASNELIKHNKFKMDKEISALKQLGDKIVLYSGNSEDENIQFCINQINRLLEEGLSGDDILFLYRRKKMYYPYRNYLKDEQLRVQSKTIHAAKGLEAKAVFILGLTDGNGGFPDIWMEDRIFQVVKKTNHDLLLEEERRLFYVAITRARDKLFLITEKGNESSFIKELSEGVMTRISMYVQPVIEDPIFCKGCSKQLDSDWIVCPRCGLSCNQISLS